VQSSSETVPRTYEWARATDGALSPAQRRAAVKAVKASFVEIGRQLVQWAFRGRGRPPLDLPVAPASALARRAEEAAAEQGAALAGHGYRTWLCGSALAIADGASPDPELLYVTSLLHDAGMMREVVGQDFTVRSAEILQQTCRSAGVDEAVARTVADAAVAHASPGLTAEDDPIGFYVQGGAMADLAGLRMWDLPRGYLRQAYRAHPAHGIHKAIPPLIRREAKQVPQGRFAILRRAGMDWMVTVSPTRLTARLS